MKTIIAFIVIMFGFNTAAQSTDLEFQMINRAQVARNVIETIPVASPKEIDKCYDAVKNGGLHTISSSKVSIYCTKGEMTRLWAE